MKYAVDGVMVIVNNGAIAEEEAMAYVERGRELYGNSLYEIRAEIDKDDHEFINLEYKWNNKPFHRLRRITGYLVGNLGRWNNAKRAEEHDRVKHSAQGGES
jgi:hypothetical protein